jgi:hypothetical protein
VITLHAVEDRLAELRSEMAEGERALRELDIRRDRLVNTLLRIGGAVQVLEELLESTAAECSVVAGA